MSRRARPMPSAEIPWSASAARAGAPAAIANTPNTDAQRYFMAPTFRSRQARMARLPSYLPGARRFRSRLPVPALAGAPQQVDQWPDRAEQHGGHEEGHEAEPGAAQALPVVRHPGHRERQGDRQIDEHLAHRPGRK